METLLREVETQLGRMTAAQRARTATALSDLIRAAGGMTDLDLSRMTTMRALQVMLFGLAQKKGMKEHLAEARRLAPTIGKHVETLLHAI